MSVGSGPGAGVLAGPLPDVVDDRLRSRAGAEEAAAAHFLELGHVLPADDPAAGQEDPFHPLLAHELEDAREERHVGARQDRQRDHVDVFLERGLDDLLGRLVEPRVDDLHPRVPEGRRDHLRSAIVPVQAGLADQHADLALVHRPSVGFAIGPDDPNARIYAPTGRPTNGPAGTIRKVQRRANFRCTTLGVATVRSSSSAWRSLPTPSKSRSPPPRRTGARWISISSTRPARR